ncbi:uncharacterized protein B0T23DRAFT_11780 [Neurospora hispaniola]|uniref:Secreted protein n=1 Tax=Neurospora hispaniola TaxID=588809 RepID=A0AAJ0IFG9_9PEZI|nr:hypothetical protein B0T23DRAFT_11780 [Neurospora hispaniola]
MPGLFITIKTGLSIMLSATVHGEPMAPLHHISQYFLPTLDEGHCVQRSDHSGYSKSRNVPLFGIESRQKDVCRLRMHQEIGLPDQSGCLAKMTHFKFRIASLTDAHPFPSSFCLFLFFLLFFPPKSARHQKIPCTIERLGYSLSDTCLAFVSPFPK